MPLILANNYGSTTLAGPISNTAVVANLASGAGALFPSPANGQYFVLTFNDAATKLNFEVVYVTSRSGDQITMIRGQEGTTALNWSAGDFALGNVTAGWLSQLAQVVYLSSHTNPNGFVAGVVATGTDPPTFCWAGGTLWACTATGPAATAVWSPASGQAFNVQSYATNGVYSFTIPSPNVYVQCWAAGGGGGGSGGGGENVGEGGGAGGYTEGPVTSLTVGVSLTVTVGTGGAAGNSSGSNGGNGGSSSFDSFMSATGGTGGAGNASGSFGLGGVGSGGTINMPGGNGNLGWEYTGVVTPPPYGSIGGQGGNAWMGPTNGFPVAPASVSTAGHNGIFPGQGGSGAAFNANGGQGHDGMVVIRW